MEVRHWLAHAARRLSASDSPKRDAEILLGFVLGKSRSWLIAFDDAPLGDAERAQADALLARRAHGEPVAHLTGEREFWSLPLSVSAATLIPRPDTETLVEAALALLPADAASLLDLGTGSGAIALALASERPSLRVLAVDRVPEAVALAQHNARRLGLSNVTVSESNWFSGLAAQRFSMIVSNPPYIDPSDHHLQQGDVRFEPLSALVADEAGLSDLQQIIGQAPDWLAPGGWLLLEHGWQQGEAVRQRMRAAGYQQVHTRRDYGNNERVTLGHVAHL
ncbi:peptide chain release factor N(5)-glutamine methyltransferase [Pantoea sp. 1.19]|uniref:peptide chain release factor N(5)-glutamine methyltransferase n=1 Tax=Pantoea sp. 1.19 TaxID=1925589 RepID=UPI000948DFEA|nr:peptide chain release factor N(5)-glutamine methyltransferase [Pantoea sp. 1.19]